MREKKCKFVYSSGICQCVCLIFNIPRQNVECAIFLDLSHRKLWSFYLHLYLFCVTTVILIRVSIKSSISMFYSFKLPSFPASSAQPDTIMLYLLALMN